MQDVLKSLAVNIDFLKNMSLTQPAFTCSKLTIETLEQGVKYVFFMRMCAKND